MTPFSLIRISLTINNRTGHPPSDEALEWWLDDLEEQLGDLDPARLKASLAAAWKAHRDSANSFGNIVPADVVTQYRRGKGSQTFQERMPPDCPGCREGLVTLRRPEGAGELVAPCSCPAGDERRKMAPAVYGRYQPLAEYLEQGCRVVGDWGVVA